MASERRALLLPVDDSDGSQWAFDWMLQHMFRPGDEIHLLHVIPRVQFATSVVPAIDFQLVVDKDASEASVRKAETFIVKRFLSRLPEKLATTPIVHLIKSETDVDSLGHVICRKAEEIKAAAIIMAAHARGAVAEFFLGSISQWVLHHTKRTVTIVHGSC